MKKLTIALLAFGLVALFAFYLGAIKGEIKWSAGETLTGAKARLIGMISLVVGLILLGSGGYLATFVFNR